MEIDIFPLPSQKGVHRYIGMTFTPGEYEFPLSLGNSGQAVPNRVFVNGNYDFPLTDTRDMNEIQSRTKNCEQWSTSDLYLTQSLGVNHYDWHYKLVAGVVDLAA